MYVMIPVIVHIFQLMMFYIKILTHNDTVLIIKTIAESNFEFLGIIIDVVIEQRIL